jgi:hypothetical protein
MQGVRLWSECAKRPPRTCRPRPTRQKSDHLLRDLLFDDAGHRMIAAHATKGWRALLLLCFSTWLHGLMKPFVLLRNGIVAIVVFHARDRGQIPMPKLRGAV